jgi:hypothetical protein
VTFYSQCESTRAVVLIGLEGYEDEGWKLGTIRVDDLRVEPWAGPKTEP